MSAIESIRQALNAVEAITRHLNTQWTAIRPDDPRKPSAGPIPSNAECPKLVKALVAWIDTHRQEVHADTASLVDYGDKLIEESEVPLISGGMMKGLVPWEWPPLIRKCLLILDSIRRQLEGLDPDLAMPWEGPEWDQSPPQLKRLLRYMHGRQSVSIDQFCREIWGDDNAEGRIGAALSRANHVLIVAGYHRSLEKVRGEDRIRWIS